MGRCRIPGRPAVPLVLVCAVLLGAVLPGAALPASAATVDPLWTKAVELMTGRADWTPGTVSLLLQLLDARGAAKDSWQSWYSLAPGEDGSTVVTITRAMHNGDDRTAREQENQLKSKREPPTRWDDPFDPKVQLSVTASPLGRTEVLNGRSCALFDFTLSRDDSTLRGTAWLDAASGAPVQVRYSSDPLPAGLASLTTTLRYAKGPAGEGFLQEASVEGVGNLLFVKRSFRSAISLGGYWRHESS